MIITTEEERKIVDSRISEKELKSWKWKKGKENVDNGYVIKMGR